MTQQKGRFWFVWGAPIALGVLSTLGLLSALLGTGLWHWGSWLMLAVPILVIVRYWCGPKPAAPSQANASRQ
ncbi:hypothetical protein [Schauerella aestuarii]|uniref:hypothetical protein n=1 Tax=Schauerella aestuarii TaxID=2511204 RepID=UPI00136AD00D|nr:hypothetical protein [Achromobacter aestuarii]MYZ45115.1 hypothetical protein [Achromobacter aestuarii]